MELTSKIVPCLWFDSEAEEAARFYVSIFKDSRILSVNRFTEAGFEIHRRPAGSVMTVNFEIAGQQLMALNGGPMFKFTEAVSLQVMCDSQAEVDEYWAKLTDGGEPSHCGWLKDRYGLSWQIVPKAMARLFSDNDPQKASRATSAMLQMQKLDLKTLEEA